MIPDNGSNPEPGPMNWDRTPYGREIANAVVDPDVRVIVNLKATQVGWTNILEMLPGYWADQDPGACLVVAPNEKTAKELLAERILATIKETPDMRKHLTGRPRDEQKTFLKLDTMPIFAAWAGSPMALASRSIRYLLLDEVDKYPPWSATEGDPIQLAVKRVSNWQHRARILIGSTPTVRTGNIWKWWESCGVKLYYFVPCPDCGEYQRLVWAQVKWPDVGTEDRNEKADLVDEGNLAYYECEQCRYQIRDNKAKILLKGRWATLDQVVDKAGKLHGVRPKSSRVGFALNSLYSPWLRFSELAKEYILAVGDAPRMMDFRNSRLAEPFEDQISKPKPKLILAKVLEAVDNNWRAAIVPRWAGLLTMAVDTQKDHFWVTVRAWGAGNKSRLIYFARLEAFDDIERVLETPFHLEGGDDELMRCRICLIDSGGTRDPQTNVSRTHEVYQFCLRNPAQLYPIRGASREQFNPIRHSQVTPKPQPDQPQLAPITLRILDTDWFKDLLSARMKTDAWQLTDAADNDDYQRGMVSEHKIFDRLKNKYKWVPVAQGAPNHPWDCETYQMAAAELAQVVLIPTEEGLEDQRRQLKQHESKRRRQQQSKRDDKRGGWAHRNKGKY